MSADYFTNTEADAGYYDQAFAYPDFDTPDHDDVDFAADDASFYADLAERETERLAAEARYGPDRAGEW